MSCARTWNVPCRRRRFSATRLSSVALAANARTRGGAGYAGVYVDADPIPIRLSLLRLGDVAIGGVNAELFTEIGQRFKREAPLKHTMMATLTNGSAPSGYIPNDAAFGYNTFEVVSSALKPGCAETAIVDGPSGSAAIVRYRRPAHALDRSVLSP